MVTVKLKTNIQLMPVPIIIKMMENEFKFNEGGGIHQLFEVLRCIATIGNMEINLFYVAWHTKSIIFLLRNM